MDYAVEIAPRREQHEKSHMICIVQLDPSLVLRRMVLLEGAQPAATALYPPWEFDSSSHIRMDEKLVALEILPEKKRPRLSERLQEDQWGHPDEPWPDGNSAWDSG